MAESKFTNSELNNPWYKIYTANNNAKNAKERETSLGTAIAIKHTLQSYIHNIQSMAGTALYIDLFFPNKMQIQIISIFTREL